MVDTPGALTILHKHTTEAAVIIIDRRHQETHLPTKVTSTVLEVGRKV